MANLASGASPEQAPPRVGGEARAGASGELLRDVLSTLRRHFAMDVAFLAEVREGERILRRVDAAPGAPSLPEGRVDPLERTLCQRVLDGRLPELLHDARSNEQARRVTQAAGLPVGAHLEVPLRLRNGELYGTLCCFRCGGDATLNANDVQTMQLFAEFIGRLLERDRHDAGADAALVLRVRDVLRHRRFSMAYQPIFDVERHELVAYEALARFHAEPLQPPDRWFADAQAVGLQAELEFAAMAMALEALERIPQHVYLSLNVSPATLLEPAFATLFDGLPLGRIMLEITEHASVADYEAVARVLAPLRVAGLKLAVDDAGAGFASFRHILQLRPNVIKLDASLIRHIDRRPDSRALASALIRFAQETRCRIVAEGVETEAELALLRELAVDRALGYLLGRPGPLPAAEAQLA